LSIEIVYYKELSVKSKRKSENLACEA